MDLLSCESTKHDHKLCHGELWQCIGCLGYFCFAENPDDEAGSEQLCENCWKAEKVDLCPHCEIPLENKMFDIDGTNLVEHAVCPECGYGTPAML